MLTWNDISAYVEQGKTNEEIHTLLSSNRQYKRPIYATGGNQAWSVLSLLTMKYGVLAMNDKQEWVGSLADLAATNPVVDGMLSKLRPYLQINDARIDCTNNDVGTLVYSLCATLASLLNSNVPFDDINDLSGGLKYAGVTVEHIQAVRDAKAKELLSAYAIDTYWNPIQEAIDAGTITGQLTMKTFVGNIVAGQ
jgi:hypothetical protein